MLPDRREAASGPSTRQRRKAEAAGKRSGEAKPPPPLLKTRTRSRHRRTTTMAVSRVSTSGGPWQPRRQRGPRDRQYRRCRGRRGAPGPLLLSTRSPLPMRHRAESSHHSQGTTFSSSKREVSREPSKCNETSRNRARWAEGGRGDFDRVPWKEMVLLVMHSALCFRNSR